jgi:hypothetical protein
MVFDPKRYTDYITSYPHHPNSFRHTQETFHTKYAEEAPVDHNWEHCSDCFMIVMNSEMN